eukprot:COSAG01_NODE_44901_length_414_cov_1.292063_1_plen_35_part_01
MPLYYDAILNEKLTFATPKVLIYFIHRKIVSNSSS